MDPVISWCRRPRALAHVRGRGCPGTLARAAILLAMLAACSGQVDGKDADGRTGGQSGGAGRSAGGKAGSGGAAGALAPGPLPFRRLTRLEYLNTMTDLLGAETAGVVTDLVLSLPADSDGSAGFAEPLPITGVELDRFDEIVSRVAQALEAGGLARIPDVKSCADPDCADEFLATFGRRTFRRPLAEDERVTYAGLYQSLTAAGMSHTQSLVATVESMLLSPQFLYRWELGLARPNIDGGLARLDSHELASRLSYSLWRSMPDAALFAAADRDELADEQELGRQVTRLLQDARFAGALTDFHLQLFLMTGIERAEKNEMRYPAFNKDLRSAMKAQVMSFLGGSLREQPTLEHLLLASRMPVNGLLAGALGLAGEFASELRSADMPDYRGAGVLTTPAFLATHAGAVDSSPVRRGKVVFERLLCQHVPPPPPDVDNTPPPFDGMQQTRERLAQHVSSPNCAGCHKLMDPLGFAFENFDAIGAHRPMEVGRPVDTSGSVRLDEEEVAFSDAVDLAGRILGSQQFRRCYAVQWWRFVTGRPEVDDEVALIDDMAARVGEDGRIDDLLGDIVTSRWFHHRAVEEER